MSKNIIDLRSEILSPIANQGLLNSCTACALSTAAEFFFKQQNCFFDDHHNHAVSTMYIYYNMRLIEQSLPYNIPLTVDESVKSLVVSGVCSEVLWPYPEFFFNQTLKTLLAKGCFASLEQAIIDAQQAQVPYLEDILSTVPSAAADEQAKNHQIPNCYPLSIANGLDELKQCLSNNTPFIFAIEIPISFFFIPPSGEMQIPSPHEKRVGGHVYLAVGFDDVKQVFIIRNSYGTSFGDKGYCYIPYAFITGVHFEQDIEINNAFSFWYLGV